LPQIRRLGGGVFIPHPHSSGHGASLLGFHVVPTIEARIPRFLFSVLFGLSMDHQVFLLSRHPRALRPDREHSRGRRVWHRIDCSPDHRGGADHGRGFAGFASGDLVMFQQMGFGLGVAILVDATIVRVILMPAVMKLLGDRNRYLPRGLEWLPDLRAEGDADEPAPAARTAAATAGS
jgi:putative drug exporter of the RND superfamily